MTIDALSATNAYRNQLKMMKDGPDLSNPDEALKPSFSQLITNALQDAVNTQSASENTQIQSMTGKTELSDLVTAVASAELSLNTVVAVRDRVISAYNEIIKMSI